MLATTLLIKAARSAQRCPSKSLKTQIIQVRSSVSAPSTGEAAQAASPFFWLCHS